MSKFFLTLVLLGIITCLGQLNVWAFEFHWDPYSQESDSGQEYDLFSNDDTYMGNTHNMYDPNSIYNSYGQYGSPYTPSSIHNPYGSYGSPYSSASPNNPYVNPGECTFLDR